MWLLLAVLCVGCSDGSVAVPTPTQPPAMPMQAATPTEPATPIQIATPISTPTPTATPPTTAHGGPYLTSTLEELIFLADTITRVKLLSVQPSVEDTGSDYVEGPIPIFVFRFQAIEYLKGTGNTELTVKVPVMTGRTSPGKEIAQQWASNYLSVRDTQWDSREAVIFLNDNAVLYESSDSEDSSGQIPKTYQFMGPHKFTVDINTYAITSGYNRAWLPATTSDAASGVSGSTEMWYFTQAPPAHSQGVSGAASTDTPSISLSELKGKIKANNDLMAKGKDIVGFEECIQWSLSDATIRQHLPLSPSSDTRSIQSGQPEGTRLWPVPVQYRESPVYGKWWTSGEDSQLFVLRITNDPDNDPKTGYAWEEVTTRPVPGGTYTIYVKSQPAAWVPCDYNPEKDINLRELIITVTAATGTLHEAFFDPVAIGAGFGADATNGVLKPASFTPTDGSDMNIDSITWQEGQVKMRLTQHTTLSDKHIDFLALDASIALRLDFDAAVVVSDDGAQTLVWGVCKQPWKQGDLLMLRISESDGDVAGATSDESCLPATPTPTATPVPTATPIPTPTGPYITIGDATFAAEIADTPELRSKGLGERDSLPEQTGMLFVFPSGQASSFWMFGMRFPLDFVWIGEDCTVADLTENVQHYPPDTPSSELEIINPASPAAYTFEINAGEVAQFGIERGDSVQFHNINSEFAMCCENGACDGN